MQWTCGKLAVDLRQLTVSMRGRAPGRQRQLADNPRQTGKTEPDGMQLRAVQQLPDSHDNLRTRQAACGHVTQLADTSDNLRTRQTTLGHVRQLADTSDNLRTRQAACGHVRQLGDTSGSLPTRQATCTHVISTCGHQTNLWTPNQIADTTPTCGHQTNLRNKSVDTL